MEYKTHTLRKFGSILMGLSIMLAAHSALAAVTITELAGNSISNYPHFEYVKAINVNDNVEIAIDPTRFPAIAGQTCDIYVVAAKNTSQWNTDITLTDVTPGGMQTETFSATNIQSNTFQVAAPNQLSANAGLGLGVGYDVILDCNQDGLLNGDDYIDGRNNESGFYRVHDTTVAGPEAVTELTYSINAVVAAGFGIPAGFAAQNLLFPTNVAGVKAATGENLPLVIVSHGNGHWYEDYDHIGNHLASYGYVVMSHRNNTGPGPVSASTTTLAHTDALIDQIASSAIAGAGALTGNIDTDRIVWIGHSRGAEGVVIGYDRMFDGTYTPTYFNTVDIKLISSMLPTDFEGTNTANPHNANYHLWTASGDADVHGGASNSIAQTFHLHDRATGNKQSTVVQGTGHAWFHNGGGGSVFTGPCPIGQANTHLVQLGHFLPLVKRYVDDNIPSIDFLTRQYESFRPIGVPTGDPCIQVSHEYLDASPNTPSNPQKTIIIDDYQSQFASGTSSSGASVMFNVDNLTEDRLDDNNSDFTWTASDPFNGATQASATDTSRGVVLDWTGLDRFYEWTIPVGERDFTDNLFLSLRGAQGTRHPNTLAVLDDLTFKVTLRDGQPMPASSSISIGAFGGGFEQPYQRSSGWHNEMETIRIRLTDFLNNGSGLDLTDIVAVRLDVGPAHGSPEGRIVIDDLMLSNDRAVYDARDNGDPHIKTVNGTNYDFHGAGEYTLLQDGTDYEIQTRQTPVTTAGPLPNSYTGLSSCVAVNTALAARVGNHRISYQPDGPLDEQETRMRLRVDGVMQDIDALGSINLGVGGRVSKAASGNGIEVDFPNGSSLLVTPGWWSSHDIAYLNISVLNTPATEGIAGFIEPGQWLPRLSDGTYLGPKPNDLSDRYKDLNETFSKSWRVSNASSLFDYAPGTSTATFTIEGWPFENASSCELPNMLKVNPIDRDVAKRACLKVIDPDNRNNCVMDVAVTGEIGFAKTYLLAQKLEQAGTKTEIYPERKVTEEGDPATFIAIIKRRLTGQRLIFDDKEQRYGVGRVQFYFNGEPMGEPVWIDRFGRAQWTSPKLKAGEYKVSAKFLPAKGDDDNFTSRSFELVHLVRGH
jgi:dienelactone hydrolase